MKINYFVRSAIKGQPATIYMRYSDSRAENLQVKTPEKVFPEYWNGKKGELFKKNIAYTPTFTERDRIEQEGRLMQLKQHVASQRLELMGLVTKPWLDATINKHYGRVVGGEGLNEYLARYIKEMASGVRLNGTKRHAWGTIDGYITLQSVLNKFQGIYTDKELEKMRKNNIIPRRHKPISFGNITSDFLSDLKAYFIGLNLGSNYLSTTVRRLKTIMNASMEEGLHNNEEFKRKGFRTKMEDTDDIYLNEDEIRRVYNLDLSIDPEMDNARDVFLCGCYTVQRFSDYSIFRMENIKTLGGNRVLDFIQTKTGGRCIVPIRPELESILKKHNYKLPHIHNNRANVLIKLVCQKAGIDEMIAVEELKGGFKVKKSVPKYKMVKSHTARRSGATNMYLAGIPSIDIMKIGGWKTETSFLRYIKVTQEQTAVSLASHPFFRGEPLSVAK